MSGRPSLFRSSTSNSPLNSPGGSTSRVPQVMDSRAHHASAVPHTSPPVSAPGSVRFPWEPAQHNHQHDHSTVNSAGLHSAFAHHPFHSHQSPSSTTHSRTGSKDLSAGMSGNQHLSFDPNMPTGRERGHTDGSMDPELQGHVGGDRQAGIPMSKSLSAGGLSYQSSATAGTGILTGGTGKEFPRSRTSSTGQTTMIGPEFGYRRKVGFETFDGAQVKDSALFSYTLQVSLRQTPYNIYLISTFRQNPMSTVVTAIPGFSWQPCQTTKRERTPWTG